MPNVARTPVVLTEFGRTIRDARRKLGMTQAELGQALSSEIQRRWEEDLTVELASGVLSFGPDRTKETVRGMNITPQHKEFCLKRIDEISAYLATEDSAAQQP